MMKFITEEYLRDLYRKEPFDTYKLQQGQRLTPGAAQYLSDRRIKLNDDALNSNKNVSKIVQVEKVETVKETVNVDFNINLNKKLCYKLKSMEAVFLVTGSEILKDDIILAQML